MVINWFRRGEFDTPSINTPARMMVIVGLARVVLWGWLVASDTRLRTTTSESRCFTATSGKAGLYYWRLAKLDKITDWAAIGLT
jgi:hypothetical protein